MKNRFLLWTAPPLVLLAGVAAFILNTQQRTELHTLKQADGSVLLLAEPSDAKEHLLLAVPEGQGLSHEQLLKLADENRAQVVQVVYPEATLCNLWPIRLEAAEKALSKKPDLVAGIQAGASYAFEWLKAQPDAQAQAISVGFSLEQAHCPTLTTTEAENTAGTFSGQWLVAWNNSPSDETARFVRAQPNTEVIVTPYDAPFAPTLFAQIKRALQGQADAIPIIEHPSKTPSDTLTLFYSGDGGWRDLDRDIAERMAEKGYPVVGIDVLRYFWQHKSFEQGTADLEQLMQIYREKWGIKHFIFAGYSFGADLLPAFYNRLPPEDQQQVQAFLFLALGRTGGLEIKIRGWLGESDDEFATGPDFARLPPEKVLCVYGLDEKDESGCTQPQAVGETLGIPGGHHFDEDYEALAEKLMEAIRKRQSL